MRALKMKRKTRTIAIAGVLTFAAAGGAFAYWTTTGSGPGTAVVGTDAGVTVVQNSTVAGLVPGGAAQPIDFTVTSPLGAGAVQITSVVISIVPGWSYGSGATACTPADFTITQPVEPSVGTPVAIAGNASVLFTSAAGISATAGTTAAIAMVNGASNQDQCKLVSVPLRFTVG